MLLGRVLVEADTSQAAAGVQSILDGMRMLEDLHIKPLQAQGYLYLGETYVFTGQRDKALASLKKAREMCQEMGMDYWLARTDKALEKLKR